jgi:hypothetical protein
VINAGEGNFLRRRAPYVSRLRGIAGDLEAAQRDPEVIATIRQTLNRL